MKQIHGSILGWPASDKLIKICIRLSYSDSLVYRALNVIGLQMHENYYNVNQCIVIVNQCRSLTMSMYIYIVKKETFEISLIFIIDIIYIFQNQLADKIYFKFGVFSHICNLKFISNELVNEMN